MAKATNGRERSDQMIWLRRAAEGKLPRVTPEMKKDLMANKELRQLAVKNGVLPASKPAKMTKK